MDFISCLDAFYNAGLRYDGKKSGIYKMSAFIKKRWSIKNGIRFIISKNQIIPIYIDEIRQQFSLNDRDMYSFLTKFFHQFNGEYPIYDSKVREFLQILFPRKSKKKYVDYTFLYYDAMASLNWKKGANSFDNAIWTLIKEKQEKYNKTKKKLTNEEILKK